MKLSTTRASTHCTLGADRQALLRLEARYVVQYNRWCIGILILRYQKLHLKQIEQFLSEAFA